MPNLTPPPLLALDGVSVAYSSRGWAGFRQPPTVVLHGVSLTVPAGGAVGLVGESGSGKSTLARALVRLVPLHAGTVHFAGDPISGLSARAFFPYRKRVQMVFQDPFLSLNPRRTVGEIVGEPLRLHFSGLNASDRRERAAAALAQVRLSSDLLARFPRELSGGQRQRVGLARALAVEPELLILDEPLSALDVCLQARLLDLLAELRSRLRLALLFISHDLAVVEQLCQSVVVLRAGRVVEAGPVAEIYRQPADAYTRELLAAVPQL